MDDEVKTELQEAAAAYLEAPKRLRAAIVEAAKQGSTDAEIAHAINLTLGPDYIGRIIRAAGVKRTRGRRRISESDDS